MSTSVAISARLHELGIELPKVGMPVANYVPAVRSGNLIFTSGQLPVRDGELMRAGIVGADLTGEEATPIARFCALLAIASAADVAGGVDNLARAVKVTGFVASTPDFNGHPQVINGASDLLVDVFGSPHARSAVGIAALPLNAPVELEAIFELIDGV